LIVSVGKDEVVNIWDVKSGENKFSLFGHSLTIMCVVFFPDGKRIATGGLDKILRIWDLKK
jgi:WD40 repeat protein